MTEEIVPASPQDDEPLRQELATLPDKQDALQTLSKDVGEVIVPPETLALFYANATKLPERMTPEEKQKLREHMIVEDDDIEIRPEGIIYIEANYLRECLSEIFGQGAWSMIPLSGISRDHDVEPGQKDVPIFQRWMLVVHECYVGQAVGDGRFFINNKETTKADAAEMTASNALSRICKSLSIGANVYRRKFQREFMAKHAVEVWVKTFKGNVRRWRRKDADPLPGEIGPVKRTEPEDATEPEQKPAAPKAPPPPREGPQPAPPRKPEAKPAEGPAPQGSEPNPPMENTLTVGQTRLLFREFRKRGMIKPDENGQDDPAAALEFLLNEGAQMKTGPGKTRMEVLSGTIAAIDKSRFSELVNKIREAR